MAYSHPRSRSRFSRPMACSLVPVVDSGAQPRDAVDNTDAQAVDEDLKDNLYRIPSNDTSPAIPKKRGLRTVFPIPT